MTMGENTGYYFELDTSSGGVPVHMWNFMFTANGGYVHIDVASSGQDNASHAVIKYIGLKYVFSFVKMYTIIPTVFMRGDARILLRM